MKPFDWNSEKNGKLRATRGIGFETIVNTIAEGQLLTVLDHPNGAKYPNQKIYIVALDNYVYAVPYIETKDVISLKTIYPSRQYTKHFLKNKEQES